MKGPCSQNRGHAFCLAQVVTYRLVIVCAAVCIAAASQRDSFATSETRDHGFLSHVSSRGNIDSARGSQAGLESKLRVQVTPRREATSSHSAEKAAAAGWDGPGGANFAEDAAALGNLWVELLAVGCAGALALALYRWRMGLMEKREQRLARLVAERTAALEKEVAQHKLT